MVIFDVENAMTNDEFRSELFVKNLKAAGVKECDLRQRVRAVNRISRKGMNVGNVSVELTRSVHEILLREGRVYLKLRCCRVKEWVNLLKYYTCFAFGHMMRECPAKERLCQKCGESDHLRETCKRTMYVEIVRLRGRKRATRFCQRNAQNM